MKGITHEQDHTPTTEKCDSDQPKPPAKAKGFGIGGAVGEPGLGIAGDGSDVAGDDDGAGFDGELVEETSTDGTVFCFGQDGDFGCTRPSQPAVSHSEVEEVDEEATWTSSEILWQDWLEWEAAGEDLRDPGDASDTGRGADSPAKASEDEAGS
ncbi:MAG: hypothetical protein QF363_14340 [Planctomycetaceae bacterium]|jgi:hypothetical protein|nr:hypothetical protein [Planctomycetaceae bacterium]